MKKILPLFASILFLSFPLLAAEPEVLAVYEFEQGSAADLPLYPTGRVECEASAIQWVAPGRDESHYGFGAQNSTAYLRNSRETWNFNPETYLTFTLTAAEGYHLNLESLLIRFGGSPSRDYEGPDFPVALRVLSDAQEPPFIQELPIGADRWGEASVMVSSASHPENTFDDAEVKLGGPEFENLKNVTFRIHLFCPERSSGVFLRVDEIAVRGNVVQK